jgi:hypothetical protein
MVMTHIIDKLCDMNAAHHFDILQNISFSSCASRIKYMALYESFDINGNYAVNSTTRYTLTEKEFSYMCTKYKQHDIAAKRGTSQNITEADYDVVKTLIERGFCHMRKEGFDLSNKPILDRSDNEKGYFFNNIKPCYLTCNRYKSDKDEPVRKLVIGLKQFARQNNLLMTLCKGQEKLYHFLRKGVRGNPSNVHNRFNFQGETKIKKLKYDENDKEIKVFETQNCEGKTYTTTHCTMFDFNSLYPFCFGSIEFQFSPYTDHIIISCIFQVL